MQCDLAEARMKREALVVAVLIGAGAAAWVMDARRRGLRVGVVAIGNEVWGTFDDGFRPAARYAADLRAPKLPQQRYPRTSSK